MRVQHKDKCEVAAVLRCGEAEHVLRRTITPRDPVIVDDETSFKFDEAMKLTVDMYLILHTPMGGKGSAAITAAKKFFTLTKKDAAERNKTETHKMQLGRFQLLGSVVDTSACTLQAERKSVTATTPDGRYTLRLDCSVMFVPGAERCAVPRLSTAVDMLRDLRQCEHVLVHEGELSQYARHNGQQKYWRNRHFKLIGWKLIPHDEVCVCTMTRDVLHW